VQVRTWRTGATTYRIHAGGKTALREFSRRMPREALSDVIQNDSANETDRRRQAIVAL
jgi:hypothetical protein